MFDGDPIGFGGEAQGRVIRAPRGGRGHMRIGGHFGIKLFGPDGRLKADIPFVKNGVTLAALDDVLNKYLRNGTPPATWYMGLIDNVGFTTLAAGDTMASHGGWSEFTSYSSVTRPTWTAAAASGQSVTNSSTVNFSITATGVIKGLFITSANDKGGSTGLLFATSALAGGNLSVNNGDTAQMTYTCPLVAT